MSKNKQIFEKAREIMDSDLTWWNKYHLIFSKEISKQVHFIWDDPDIDYEDDVRAWWEGFQEFMKTDKFKEETISPKTITKMDDWQKEKAIHSMRYLFEDLTDEGWQKISEITGLPMGVVVEAKNNLFCYENAN